MHKAEIAEAFSRHDFEAALPHFAEDVVWHNVGDEVLEGRNAVDRTCQESAEYLDGIKVTFHEFKVSSGPDFVIVESLGEYEEDEENSVVASCDVYRFEDDKVVSITSYNVEIEPEGEDDDEDHEDHEGHEHHEGHTH